MSSIFSIKVFVCFSILSAPPSRCLSSDLSEVSVQVELVVLQACQSDSQGAFVLIIQHLYMSLFCKNISALLSFMFNSLRMPSLILSEPFCFTCISNR